MEKVLLLDEHSIIEAISVEATYFCEKHARNSLYSSRYIHRLQSVDIHFNKSLKSYWFDVKSTFSLKHLMEQFSRVKFLKHLHDLIMKLMKDKND